MEKAILAQDKELQKILLYLNCSPKCQLKVEPSTVSIGGQMAEICHFLCQKLVSRLSEMYGKGYFGSERRVTKKCFIFKLFP